jgi:hypothetical protein
MTFYLPFQIAKKHLALDSHPQMASPSAAYWHYPFTHMKKEYPQQLRQSRQS